MNLSYQSEEKLPELLFANFQAQIEQQLEEKKKKNIYTVYESLQDEYVAKNLDVAIGSLNMYIDMKTTDPTPQLPNLRLQQRRTRKNDDDACESIKASNTLMERNPMDLLRTADDERVRGSAAKMIVSQIFKKIYGEEVEKFEEKNSKQAIIIRNEAIDRHDPHIAFIQMHSKMSNKQRFEMFEKQMVKKEQFRISVESSSQKVKGQTFRVSDATESQLGSQGESQMKEDRVIEKDQIEFFTKKQQQEQLLSQQSVEEDNKKKFKHSQSFFGSSFKKLYTTLPSKSMGYSQALKQKRLTNILQLRTQHKDVNQIIASYWKDNNNQTELDQYIKTHMNTNNDIRDFFDRQKSTYSSASPSKIKILIQNNFQEVFIIDQSTIMVRNIELTDKAVLFLLMETDDWSSLKVMHLHNTSISEGSMKLILWTIAHECTQLTTLVLNNNRVPRNQMLERVLQNTRTIEVLGLSGVGMGSLQFVQICIVICETQIREIDLSNNRIGNNIRIHFIKDSRGIKALETLLRYVKTLVSIDMQNNQLIATEDEKSKLLKQLRKIVFHNEGLKNKNIKI